MALFYSADIFYHLVVIKLKLKRVKKVLKRVSVIFKNHFISVKYTKLESLVLFRNKSGNYNKML